MFQPFRLERYFAKHEFSARHLLCTSDCESMTIDDLLAFSANQENTPDNPQKAASITHAAAPYSILGSTWLGYTESRGAPALREAIAKLYQNLTLNEVLVHAGAEEAILNFYLAVVSRDSLVIVNTPCYQSLMEIPTGLGARVLPWQIRCQGEAWQLDIEALDQMLTSAQGHPNNQAPVVVLNMPHNPTGGLIRLEEFNHIIEICRHHGAILFMDEVYRLLEYEPKDRLPAVCEAYENGVSLSVLSKAWGLAGLRIGWLATKRQDILDKVAAIKDYNSICASAPSEQLALLALANTERIVGRNRGICSTNRELFKSFFNEHEALFSWIPPKAGSVAFPWLKSTEKMFTQSSGKPAGIPTDLAALLTEQNAELFAHRLLEETGVLLLPGVHYAFDKAFFRIGLGRRSVPDSLAIFHSWLRKNGL